MPELKLGTWNALNAFGDEVLSEERLYGGLEMVKRMDADVLAIQELTRHGVHRESLESERLEEITASMAEQGYQGALINYSPYPGVRDAHIMSLWTRVGGLDSNPDYAIRTYGKRHGLALTVPGSGLRIRGLHLDDRSSEERVRSVESVLRQDGKNTGEVVYIGDLNDMHRQDPKSRMPRALGKVVKGFEVGDYYDETKRLQRVAGKVLRVCRMAEGEALAKLMAAGLHDADPSYQPTIGSGVMAFQLDHVLGSSGVTFDKFTIHPRSLQQDDEPLADHSPLTVRAKH